MQGFHFTPGMRLMVVAALAFSVMSVFVKLAGQTLPTSMIVLARAAFSLVVTWMMLKRAKVAPWGNERMWLVARGIAGTLGLALSFYAFTHLPLGEATVIFYTNPVFTGLLAALFLGERLHKSEWLATLACVLGVAVVAAPNLSGAQMELPLSGLAAAFFGAICAACAYVIVRKLRSSDDPLVIVFYFPLVALPLVTPFAIQSWVWPEPMTWFYLLMVGVCTQIGQVAMTRGLHLEKAGKATSLSYLKVVFAFIWGALLFNNPIRPTSVIGALIIVTAILALGRSKAKPAPDSQTPAASP